MIDATDTSDTAAAMPAVAGDLSAFVIAGRVRAQPASGGYETDARTPAQGIDDGVEAEVIDPRTLRPLDLDSILASVAKTNHVVIVEEGWPHGGVGANLSALITEQAFDNLDAPPQRVTGADVHMPYSKRLEQAAIPHQEHIVSAALATLEGAMR